MRNPALADSEKVRIAGLWLDSLGMSCSVSLKDEIWIDYMNGICNGRTPYEARKDIANAILKICADIESVEALSVRRRAYDLLSATHRPEIIRLSEEISRKSPGDFDALYLLGLEYYKHNDLEKAEQCFLEVSRAVHYHFLSFAWLAKTYMKMNDIPKGLSVLERFKKSRYYVQDRRELDEGIPAMLSGAKQYIDHTASDLEQKLARGYVFKPRKRIGGAP